jgi:hypothetical protein
MELETIVDVAGTAEWRRRAADQYPEDERNARAVQLLEKIAPEIDALNDSDLHKKLEVYWFDPDDGKRTSEIIGEELRNVGFRSFPESGKELLEAIISRIDAL